MASIDELRAHLESEKARLKSFDLDPNVREEIRAGVTAHIAEVEKQIADAGKPAKPAGKATPP